MPSFMKYIYVDRNKKDTTKPIAPNQRYRTRVLKLLPRFVATKLQIN